jgi:hypothetical protein
MNKIETVIFGVLSGEMVVGVYSLFSWLFPNEAVYSCGYAPSSQSFVLLIFSLFLGVLLGGLLMVGLVGVASHRKVYI